MNCIIHITTKQAVNTLNKSLENHLGTNMEVAEVFAQTSLSEDDILANLQQQYFYGNINHSVNFLIANESANTIRIFVEGVNRRDNIDQLITGTNAVFQNVLQLFEKKKIKIKKASATIWSEGEEMLRGEYQKFWMKIKSFLPTISAGIYLTILTILYSIIQPYLKLSNNSSTTTIEGTLKSAIINLFLVAIAIFIWLLIKAASEKSNLSFKLK
jgi:hypothetical protein